MNVNAWFVPSTPLWLGLLLCGGLTLTGCHQTYQHRPMYGQQFAPTAPYGQPYGQPMAPMQMQMAPTQIAPGISSIPQDNFYAPSPIIGGGDAPVFGNPATPAVPGTVPGNSGQNSVPRYNDPTTNGNNTKSPDSPYFQQGSITQGGYVPQMAQAPVNGSPLQLSREPAGAPIAAAPVTTEIEPATFAQQDNRSDNRIDLTAGEMADEEQDQFEPPVNVQSAARQFAAEPAAGEEAFGFQEPQPMSAPAAFAGNEAEFNPIPPVPVNDPPTAAFGNGFAEAVPVSGSGANDSGVSSSGASGSGAADGLEGTVRFKPERNEWVLLFMADASGNAPYGGQLPLTGEPQVLKSLQDGQSYRLFGYLDAKPAASTGGNPQFHVQKVESLGSPFAPR